MIHVCIVVLVWCLFTSKQVKLATELCEDQQEGFTACVSVCVSAHV